MKDKRNYLKLACLLEIIYVVFMLVYYVFFTKFNDEVLASVFMLLIGLGFAFVLYGESKKDINHLKENKIKVIIASIWLFLEPIIPGIFGFVFLSSIGDKKTNKLPLMKDEKQNAPTVIKAVIAVLAFIFITFVLPRFSFMSKVPSYVLYLVILLSVLLLYHKELWRSFKIFVSNFKVYLPFIIKRYLIMLGVMLVVAIPIVFINNGQTSTNQALINAMFKKIPVATLVLSTIYAPFVEESVFRLSLSKLFTNKTLFVVISGVLFGSLHVIDKFTSYADFLYVFQYSALGMCLAKAYADSKNIFVSMSMHFIQNFLAAVLVLLLY